jgi:hypothetical protein
MPIKDPEKLKEYKRQYYLKNKEKLRIKNKEYRENNKDKNSEYQKEYRKNNKEKLTEYRKEYEKNYYGTDEYWKTHRISNWKKIGVIHDNYDDLYKKFIDTDNCELCNIKLTYDTPSTKTTKCLDHNHKTNEFRNILCWDCNINIVRDD